MGFKMTGIIDLVGTEHMFSILGPILFKIFPKNKYAHTWLLATVEIYGFLGIFMIVN